MTGRRNLTLLGTALALGAACASAAAPRAVGPQPASVPEIGSPELAAPGPHGAGTMERQVVARDRLDPLASLAQGAAVTADRHLPLLIWYPARAHAGGQRVTYAATLTGEPGKAPSAFTVPGLAVAGAPADGHGFPLVVLSHGYNNDPAMMAWLGENLATKGYVVVAIAHRDPPITDRARAPATLLARPLDIVDVIRSLRGGLLGDLADTGRIALVGYSFGGYGMLTVAGARLDPAGPMVGLLPAPLVARYAGGADGEAPDAGALRAEGVAAVVAIAPAGGAPWGVWGRGLARVTAPLLVIAGSEDRTVGYDEGPAALFAAATGADRRLLTFRLAGHSIGTGPVPAEMRGSLWDFDWFEDAVWRKARINAISTHFITAFLDLHLKGQADRASYLAVPDGNSGEADWKGAPVPYAAVSRGGDNPVWKGFVRGHDRGLTMRHLPAGTP